MNPVDPKTRMARALVSLDGLSVGDSFGERFFVPRELAQSMVEQRDVPRAPWRYTDDTEMALAIVQVLEDHGHVDQDALARLFATRYRKDKNRGYGGTAHDILQKMGLGMPWREVSGEVFEGQGSMGNGGAMRVAPLGAYFEGDMGRVVSEARASAEVTHAHPEGQAGAIAIAVAAAWACQWPDTRGSPRELFDVVLDLTPDGATRRGIEKARAWSLDASPSSAARELGSGQKVISEDTVPFALWCAVRHLDSYEEALWTTVAGFGDRDTTCAIVGGIVALSAGAASIPATWRSAREPLRRRV
ncbi:ADP-ribosylglycohydrolase family protein [Pyxidicoccus fallax]|uniref:ADP-ribosylglycohydrolase family protein n=1 Tax=Pyxidicoccus fallax TaxID=394095 RepID=A0A848LRR8_9BACT|nr:ADP-ribosylglycohydrolase family protein [Pyxidicoccus fallax]NMO20381.1 ADP-ribosylglycohydrolase family protein [Pyxidicoccus fallax]NPC84684.1 ADP-ribosylglycohydrolase family protein [Pyxidicoccus fallax]